MMNKHGFRKRMKRIRKQDIAVMTLASLTVILLFAWGGLYWKERSEHILAASGDVGADLPVIMLDLEASRQQEPGNGGADGTAAGEGGESAPGSEGADGESTAGPKDSLDGLLEDLLGGSPAAGPESGSEDGSTGGASHHTGGPGGSAGSGDGDGKPARETSADGKSGTESEREAATELGPKDGTGNDRDKETANGGADGKGSGAHGAQPTAVPGGSGEQTQPGGTPRPSAPLPTPSPRPSASPSTGPGSSTEPSPTPAPTERPGASSPPPVQPPPDSAVDTEQRYELELLGVQVGCIQDAKSLLQAAERKAADIDQSDLAALQQLAAGLAQDLEQARGACEAQFESVVANADRDGVDPQRIQEWRQTFIDVMEKLREEIEARVQKMLGL